MSKIKAIEDALKAAARIAPAETGVGKLLQSMPNEPPSSAPVQQALDVACRPCYSHGATPTPAFMVTRVR
jgi:hypothetical protein